MLNELNKIASDKFGEEVKIKVSSKPDWGNAPDWAKWVAQSADGCWEWFSTKPAPHNFGLYVKGTFMPSGKGKKECVETEGTHILTKPNPDWKKTVMKRPFTKT